MAAYGTAVGTLAGVTRLTRHEIPDGLSVRDVILGAVATHKLSRLVTKDPVTSPLRAPFTVYRDTEGPAELKEDVRGRGAQKTIGGAHHLPVLPRHVGGDRPDGRTHLPSARDPASR